MSPKRARARGKMAAPRSMGPTTDAAVCGAIFAIAFALRVLVLLQIESIPVFYHLPADPRTYDDWAQRIIAGDWLGHGVFYQAPLYPYFLAVLQLILGHDLWSIRIAQLLLGAAACSLLYVAGKWLYSRAVGLAAAAILCFYAPAIFFSSVLDKTAIDLFLVAALLTLLSAGHAGYRASVHFAIGLTLGLLALSRENALIWVCLVPIWIWARAPSRPRMQLVKGLGLFVLGLGLVLTPVALRNLYVGGQFALTTSQMGPNFYIGNNPSADGTYASISLATGEKQFEQAEAKRLAEQAVGHPLTAREISSYWLGRAMEFIGSHPLEWLRLLARKWLIVWNVREIEDSDDYYLYQQWSVVLACLAWIDHFGTVVPLAVAGVAITWRQWRRLWLLYAFVLSFAASVALFFVFGRYRFPVVPFLALFAAAGVVEATASCRNRQFKTLAGYVSALLIAALFVHWPVLARPGPSATGYNYLANAYADQDRIDDAIQSTLAALAIDSTSGVAHYNLANFYLKKGRVDDAIQHYRQAIRVYPRYVPARVNLGNVLALKGQLRDAAEQYEEALKVDPEESRIQLTAAEVAARLGRLDESMRHFQQAVKINPDWALAHVELGKLLAQTGNTNEAVEHFRAAVRIEPGWAEPHLSLAAALASLGRSAEAAEHYQLAVKLVQAQKKDAPPGQARGR